MIWITHSDQRTKRIYADHIVPRTCFDIVSRAFATPQKATVIGFKAIVLIIYTRQQPWTLQTQQKAAADTK